MYYNYNSVIEAKVDVNSVNTSKCINFLEKREIRFTEDKIRQDKMTLLICRYVNMSTVIY